MNSTEEKVLEHDKRILDLEANDKEQDRRIRELEQNYSKLESTIIQENRDTRLIFQSTMNKQWDLIKSAMTSNENDKLREHELEKTKQTNKKDLTIKLIGAGSIGYLLIQSILDALLS